MSTHITFRTYTGSTYELKIAAADVKGAPAIARHTKGPYVPPEACQFGARWVNVESFDVRHSTDAGGLALFLVYEGGSDLRTSRIEDVEIAGLRLPIGDLYAQIAAARRRAKVV